MKQRMEPAASCSRRQFHHRSAMALAAWGLWPLAGLAHNAGPVTPPRLAPNLTLTDHLGRTRLWRDALLGSVTLAQTMFTGCSTVCPIQGAVMAELQRRLPSTPTRQPVRLLSLSVDALGDSPPQLQAWLQRHQAQDPWWAAVPSIAGVDALQRTLDGPLEPPRLGVDSHSDRLYVFDAQGLLRWRSSGLPALDEIMRAVGHYAA